MADLIGTPVATQIKPFPQTSLADMLNIAQTAQSLKQAQIMNPLQAQQAKELVAQSQLSTKKAEMGFSEDKMKKISSSQISMINNPLVIAAERNPEGVDPAKLRDLVINNGMRTAKNLGIPEDQAMQLLQPYIDQAMTSPAGLRQYYKERHIQSLDEAARTALFQPSGQPISSGAGGYTVQTGEFGPYQPGQIIPGTAYRATLGPAEQFGIGGTDITGRPYVIQRSPTGEPIGMTQVPMGLPGVSGLPPAGAAPAGGPAGAPAAADGTRPYPPPPPVTGAMPNLGAPVPSNVPVFPSAAGGAAGVQASQSLFQSIGQAAATAPTERQNSNKIIKLADEAITGKGAQAIAALGGGYAALPFTSDATTNLQELGHYMALQTAALSQSTGFSTTDAARGISEEMAGNVQWTAPAIKKTARVNRALSAANELLYDGIRRAAAAQPNNPEVARQYRDQWAQSMGTQGIDAIRLIDAYQNRGDDPEGVQDIIKEFGGVKSEKFKAVMRKADELSKMMGQ